MVAKWPDPDDLLPLCWAVCPISKIVGGRHALFMKCAAHSESTARKYMKKYDRLIFKEKEATMEALAGNDFKITAACTGMSAAGLDQWAPGDLKLLSNEAYDSRATLLNVVEEGAEWPRQVQHVRAAFLSKTPDDALNPLEYRVLLMLPAVHRMWSKTRLRHLQP